MQRRLPWPWGLFMVAGLSLGGDVRAQGNCQNQFMYPGQAIVPNANGTITNISTCVFFQEYSQITGVLADNEYEFTIDAGGYITVREGAAGGPVVAQGYNSVIVTTTNTNDLFAHWNVNDQCAQATNCQTANVQRLLDCVFPEVTTSFNVDCDNGQYELVVEVVSLGDASTVTVTYDTGSATETFAGVGLETLTLGPFALSDIIDLTVVHDGDADCTLQLNNLQPVLDCPIPLVCGDPAISGNYCYVNNDVRFWTYVGDGPGTIMLSFESGSMEPSWSEQFAIYDGTDATGLLLFQHTAFNNLDLAGLQFFANSGAIHIAFTSDGFGSCADGFLTEWNWQVVCLNCQLPQATTTIIDDCANNAFSIDLDVTSTGDGSTVEVVYVVNGGDPTILSGVGTGITTLGPFTVNDQVEISVLHESDANCNVSLGTFTDTGLCPTLIECGQPAFTETYCYGPSDFTSWGYEAVGTGTLRLTFIRGTIESSSFDRIRIYDGSDNTGTLMFSHDNFQTYNLGPVGSAINNTFYPYYGVEVYSTTGTLYMEMESDGSVECGGPFPQPDFDSWEWVVVCLDCSIPLVTSSVVDDCANNQFSIPLDITSTGDGASVNVVYTVNGGDPEVLTGVGLGETVLGPFAINDVVNVVVEHESNELCNISLGNITDTGTCPTLIDCGTEFNETLCHGDMLDVTNYYQGTGTFPLALFFNGGYLEDCCDRLFVYDGADVNAPELTPPGGAFGDLTGLFFSSTNPEHRLTVRITTDGSVSCQTGFQVQLDWTFSCLDCNPPAATFEIVQDCDNFQYFVNINVSTLGTDPEVVITNTAGLPDSTITAEGTYLFGPIVSGTPVQFTLENDANSLCNLYSATLVNPLCPVLVCGATPVAETYCYTANENHAWAYALPGGSGTLHITFDQGTIESSFWDVLTIYDGPDANGTILFQHTAFDTYNLGPVGSAVNNTFPNFYGIDLVSTTGSLYMTLTSDGSVQCGDPFPTVGFDTWEWQVYCEGCAPPGIAYNLVPNCLNRTFKTEVIVTDPPATEGLEITNTITGQTILANDIGVYEFGPYDQNDPVEFEFVSLDNPLCSYFSDTLTYSSLDCVIRTCGFDNYTYCYTNDENRWYTFQADAGVPITIGFLEGQMLPGDRIVLYNGYDETAAVLYQGNNGGNLVGFELNSQNVNNVLTLRIQSDDEGSCNDENSTLLPMQWYVACGAVGITENGQGGFAIYPNPTNGLLQVDLAGEKFGNVQLRVLDMSGRIVIDQPFDAKGGGVHTLDLNGLMSGQYMVQLTTESWIKTQMVQLMR